jgi:hypothetical protein
MGTFSLEEMVSGVRKAGLEINIYVMMSLTVVRIFRVEASGLRTTMATGENMSVTEAVSEAFSQLGAAGDDTPPVSTA